MVSARRSTTASPAPQKIACFCWCLGSERAASAITTALSPDRMMLTQMMTPSPIQNSGDASISIARLPPPPERRNFRLKQPDDLAVDEVDLVRRGHLRQSRHGHDVAAD